MPEFVEFAGKKEYKCPRCKAPIRYARFFGDDKKLLTTDGKPANNKFGRDSNTGWPTDPNTKQMHECKKDVAARGIDVPVSELKQTAPLDTGWEDSNEKQSLTELDEKVRDRIIEDAYLSAKFLIWKLEGVEKACKELGIDIGQVSGMVFKEVCAEDRSLRDREQ